MHQRNPNHVIISVVVVDYNDADDDMVGFSRHRQRRLGLRRRLGLWRCMVVVVVVVIVITVITMKWTENKNEIDVNSVNSHFLLSSIFNPRREAKVCNLHLHCIVDEHVAEFEVAMYDVSTVDVLTALDQVTHEESHFRLSQRRSRLEYIHQRLHITSTHSSQTHLSSSPNWMNQWWKLLMAINGLREYKDT